MVFCTGGLRNERYCTWSYCADIGYALFFILRHKNAADWPRKSEASDDRKERALWPMGKIGSGYDCSFVIVLGVLCFDTFIGDWDTLILWLSRCLRQKSGKEDGKSNVCGG